MLASVAFAGDLRGYLHCCGCLASVEGELEWCYIGYNQYTVGAERV